MQQSAPDVGETDVSKLGVSLERPLATFDVPQQPGTLPKKYGGAVAAVVTPCRSPGEPDPDRMRAFCRRLVREGCDGLFLLGSTGELPLLDEPDRQRLVAAAREGAGPAIVYAGVSGTGLKQSIRYAAQAADAGADVAVLMAPFFLKLSQHELFQYVVRLADVSTIPIAIYHHLRMPSGFEVETVARLAEHANIVAMKDTSVNLERMRELVDATSGSEFSLFQGSEGLILSSLEAGADGCVCALANIVPRWHRILVDAVAAGDQTVARSYQEQITLLTALFRLKAMSTSFGHFTFALRRAAQALGWLDNAYGMIEGFTPEPTFESEVLSLLTQHQLLSGFSKRSALE